MATGYVHSTESGSFVDGPGVRFVVFLAGCPLRCQYCHNPDTWRLSAGTETDSASLLERIAHTAGFLRASHGGVTVSGGEPLMQAEFAHAILHGAKELGLHTALDTSGFLEALLSDEMLGDIDLVILDIKSFDEATYREVTGGELAPTLRLARRLSDLGKRMWIRFVLVPGLTDDPQNVAGLARFVGTLSGVERVEVVPFHQMGRRKWEELGIPYPLEHTPPPSAQMIERVQKMFAAEKLHVAVGASPHAPSRVEKSDSNA